MTQSLFELGTVVSTPGALSLLEALSLTPMQFLLRHQSGDYGDLCAEDRQANEQALIDNSRLFSSYQVTPKDKIWVITEADRSSTCCLLPEEY